MSSDAAPTVVVALKDKATEEMVRFRVKPSMKMGRLLGKYEKHKGVGSGTFRYLIDGDRILSSEVNEKLVQKYLDEYGEGDDGDGVACGVVSHAAVRDCHRLALGISAVDLKSFKVEDHRTHVVYKK